tara:strand:- start:3114 stop:4772 length:1659 start_codon:yes stop_codon:yes gene_type:complete
LYTTKLEKIRKALHSSIYNRSTYLLTLVDKSPKSSTFGCFDRYYWHYKIKDFASGMSQEAVYPLSLALKNNIFNNLTENSNVIIKNIISGSVSFSLSSQNRNGSVDDYYPLEQAAGATAFSAFAILSSMELGLVSLSDKEHFLLKKRIKWLIEHKESGRLANHEALICLVLSIAANYFQDDYFQNSSIQRIQSLLKWKNDEGWFEEYAGFDVGYETLTFSCLLRLIEILPESYNLLADVIHQQAQIIIDSIEPDGCLGGELYSRGTWNCFTHGLVKYALIKQKEYIPKVLELLETKYIKYPYEIKDDYIIQHHLWSDILTYQLLDQIIIDNDSTKVQLPMDKIIFNKLNTKKIFPNSGHAWINHGCFTTHISIKMGGLFRIYKNDKFFFQDTQNILSIGDVNYSANILNNKIKYKWVDENNFLIEGFMIKNKTNLMSTIKLLSLRIFMYSLGRFFPNLMRSALQKYLINARLKNNRIFKRTFQFLHGKLIVVDTYSINKNEGELANLVETSFSTFRHVVMSRIFHPYNLILNKPKSSCVICNHERIQLTREW